MPKFQRGKKPKQTFLKKHKYELIITVVFCVCCFFNSYIDNGRPFFESLCRTLVAAFITQCCVMIAFGIYRMENDCD